jgi:hypothetical protein
MKNYIFLTHFPPLEHIISLTQVVISMKYILKKNLDIDQQHELQCSTSTSSTDFLEEHQNTHIFSFLKKNIKCTNIISCLCCERLSFHKQLTLILNIFLMKLQPFKTFL